MIIELIINRDRGKKKREERRGMNETADFSSDDRYNGRREGDVLRGQLGGFSLTGEYSKGKR